MTTNQRNVLEGGIEAFLTLHRDFTHIEGLWRNRRAFAMVLGFTAAGSLTFYTFTTYMQKYLVNTAGMTARTASVIMTAALFVFIQ